MLPAGFSKRVEIVKTMPTIWVFPRVFTYRNDGGGRDHWHLVCGRHPQSDGLHDELAHLGDGTIISGKHSASPYTSHLA